MNLVVNKETSIVCEIGVKLSGNPNDKFNQKQYCMLVDIEFMSYRGQSSL